MILKNAKIYSNGVLKNGIVVIEGEKIQLVRFDPSEEEISKIYKTNKDTKEIDCHQKIIIPGLIDVHTHLRDLDQKQKETFQTGTKAAASSGITTIFNMPNTIPRANSSEVIKYWKTQAINNIYVDVGFISGIPNSLNEEEIKKILNLGVMGFKIYPLDPICNLDWKIKANFRFLLYLSAKYQFRIFIHPQFPITKEQEESTYENYVFRDSNLLKLHDKLNPCNNESQFIEYTIDNYSEVIQSNNLKPSQYPIVHFCHISCMDSLNLIKSLQQDKPEFKITFEVTPHHLLLSNELELKNPAIAKVMPPLRDRIHSEFLFDQLKSNQIEILATDHAPHTIEEKFMNFFDAPSGFPGLETYPLLLLNKVCEYELSLDIFVKASSENPAEIFNLKNKGFIKKGYDADLVIIDKIDNYSINSKNFHTKAKFSPYDGFKTRVQIWKVFLRGKEIKKCIGAPTGKLISFKSKL